MLFVLFAVVAAMAQTPKQSVAVYMAGTEPPAVKGAQKVLGAELAKALAKSGNYTAVDRTSEVIKVLSAAEIFREDGAIDVDKAKRVGKQLGAQVVCVAEISEVMKSYFLEARLVNVETAEVSNVGSMYGDMTGAEDVARISQAVAMELMGIKRKLVDYTYREIKANPDKAIKDYTEAIQQEPDNSEYYDKRGLAYFEKHKYNMAIMDFSEAIRLNPKNAEYYRMRAISYLNINPVAGANMDGKLRALADMKEALRLDPKNWGYYITIGTIYYGDIKDYDQAFANYNQAIRLNPNNATIYYARGFAYADKGDFDRAILDFNEVIRLDPNNEYVTTRMARQRIDDLAKKQLNSNSSNTKNDIDEYFKNGKEYLEKQNYNKAIGNFSKSIKKNPKNADVYLFRGFAYKEKGVYNKAIMDYNEAIRLNPSFVEAYNHRGGAYYYAGAYDRAIADWESALKINPNHASAKKNLEMVKKQLGR
jgi:tetratricopeptide (TPR) repeat protein